MKTYGYEQAKLDLEEVGQEHLLLHYNTLSEEKKIELLEEISSLDFLQFKKQQTLLKAPAEVQKSEYQPFKNCKAWKEKEYSALGKESLQKGVIGVVLVAGGEGSRLGYQGPKGSFSISPVKEKSLFQLIAEKVVAASQMVGVKLPIAVMTSSTNHRQTVDFFKQHALFGLDRSQLSFFEQKDLPLLDKEGNLFLQDVGRIAKGATGNGAFVDHFINSLIYEEWKARGIESFSFIMVDNPLADPFDLELIGYHISNQDEITIKCVERKDPSEKVGLLVVNQNDLPLVVEYSEIGEEASHATCSDGSLLYPLANISLFCMRMDFIERLKECPLPLHLAFKAVNYLNSEGKSVRSKEPIAYKFEQFIFDILPFGKNVHALIYPREECFAPLKNRSGSDSPETVKEALFRRDQKQWKKIAGTEPSNERFELAQEFYYPTKELLAKWKGVECPGKSYII